MIPRDLPIFFGSSDHLFGLVTAPPDGQRRADLGVILHLGPTIDETPVAARLANRLGAEGVTVLRYDQSGHGESFARGESDKGDIECAVELVTAMGLTRVMLVGHRQTASAVLAAAISDAVAGVVVASMPVVDSARKVAQAMTIGDYLRRGLRLKTLRSFLDPSRRRRYAELVRAKAGPAGGGSRRGVEADLDRLHLLAERGTPVLLIYGSDDTQFRDLKRRSQVDLAQVQLMESTPGVLAGFPTIAAQDQFIDDVTGWVSERLNET